MISDVVIYSNKYKGFENQEIKNIFIPLPLDEIYRLKTGDDVWMSTSYFNYALFGFVKIKIKRVYLIRKCNKICIEHNYGFFFVSCDSNKQKKIFKVRNKSKLIDLIKKNSLSDKIIF